MFPFGVTIPATVPQRSEFPAGLTNYPVYIYTVTLQDTSLSHNDKSYDDTQVI